MKRTPSSILESQSEIRKTMQRRSFLKSMAGYGGLTMVGSTSAMSILQMMIQGAVSKAYGQSSGSEPRTFLEIYLSGGFPAQFFYLPLKPYSSNSYVHNVWNSNNWVGGAPVYSTVALSAGGQTLNLPHIWGHTVPLTAARGGGQAPISSLLTNSLFARGFWNPFNSHEIGATQISRPSPTDPSIAGMVADRTEAPIPAVSVGYGGLGEFNARKKGIKRVSQSGNPVSTLVTPFSADTNLNNFLAKKDQFSSLFQDALAAVAADARRVSPGSEAVLSTLSGAETLFRRSFGNLNDVYTALRNKYADLIARSYDLSGLLTSTVNPLDLKHRANDRTDGRTITTTDLRAILTSSSGIFKLAEGFATAEFLIVQGLSKAILIEGSSVYNCNYTTSTGVSDNSITTDQHNLGIGPSIVGNNFYARALAACLNEMTLRLKETGKFSDTVMKIGSEFTRSPRNDGSGGDHAWEANCFMLLSGAIKKPSVVGNISLNYFVRNHPGSYEANTYLGTYGVGATNNMEGSNGTHLNLGHYASTISSALKVPSPTPNFTSLITETSTDGIIAAVPTGETRDD